VLKSSVLKEIFAMKTIAVIGYSPNLQKPSNYVSQYMNNQGYNIIPVNPGHLFIDNKKCYPNLNEIDEKVDIVNIFRKSEFVIPIVKSAIAIKARAIWMQDNVYSHPAEKIVEKSDLLLVMDDCIMRSHISHNK